jgi:lysophospholipase L1-like esterase
LTEYVQTAQRRNAIPVLVTPVSKRRFSDTGEFVPTLPDYAEAVRRLAAQLDVPVIDLNRSSAALYEQWGREWTQRLFLWLTPGEHPNYPEGKQDNSHFNEYGAHVVAKLVIEELRSQQLPFASRLINHFI